MVGTRGRNVRPALESQGWKRISDKLYTQSDLSSAVDVSEAFLGSLEQWMERELSKRNLLWNSIRYNDVRYVPIDVPCCFCHRTTHIDAYTYSNRVIHVKEIRINAGPRHDPVDLPVQRKEENKNGKR